MRRSRLRSGLITTGFGPFGRMTMATEIRVPTLGESVSEATVGRWFKKPGDPVKAEEPLVELETDKVTLEVNAPAAGTLGDISAKDGETVTPGALLGSIVQGAGASASASAKATTEAPKAESGVDPAGVAGSGKDGRITKGDIMAAIERAAAQPTPVGQPVAAIQARAPSPADDAAREERVKMTRLRQTIAR